MIEQAVILCGGKGTRLGEIAKDTPKSLVMVDGLPLLDRTVGLLHRSGIRKIILAAGHMGKQIADHAATLQVPGLSIEVHQEEIPRGTAGAMHEIAGALDETFLLIYGDIFLDFDAAAFMKLAGETRALGTLLVRQSDHPWDSHLVEMDGSGRVLNFIVRQEPGRHYANWANAAVYALSRRILEYIPQDGPSDFGKDVFPAALRAGEVISSWALPTPQYVKDMGTPGRLKTVERYLARKQKAERARRHGRRPKAVFLDRDGTLNELAGLVSSPQELVLKQNAAECVRRLNETGLKCYVITNQPVLARGLCDEKGLAAIHRKLVDEIEKEGGRIDGIYYCPHHPETHHGEGVKELRVACECRKPAPGLLFQAAEENGLDLAECVMVGDSPCDIEAAAAAGVRSVGIGSHAGADCQVASLEEAVDWILSQVTSL